MPPGFSKEGLGGGGSGGADAEAGGGEGGGTWGGGEGRSPQAARAETRSVRATRRMMPSASTPLRPSTSNDAVPLDNGQPVRQKKASATLGSRAEPTPPIPMLRFPKRTAKLDEAVPPDDPWKSPTGDEEPVSSITSAELIEVDADMAEAVLARRSGHGQEPVRDEVMASLEAEVSRAMADPRAHWVGSPPARLHGLAAPPAPARPPRALAPKEPLARAVPRHPSGAPLAPAPGPSIHLSSVTPLASSRERPSIVVVRERPAFGWLLASLAAGAIAAVVGMQIANRLDASASREAPRPTPEREAKLSPAPPPALAASSVSCVAAPAPSGVVIAFDEKDAVLVGREPRPTVPPAPPHPSAKAPASQAPSAPSASTKASDPAALVPDPPIVRPVPPPPAPRRAKTPEERLLEAQLKASSK